MLDIKRLRMILEVTFQEHDLTTKAIQALWREDYDYIKEYAVSSINPDYFDLFLKADIVRIQHSKGSILVKSRYENI